MKRDIRNLIQDPKRQEKENAYLTLPSSISFFKIKIKDGLNDRKINDKT